PGDLLSSHDGQWVALDAVRDDGGVETVYNLGVREFHTYFVGSRQWEFSVWAHNSCGTLSDAELYKYARKVAAAYNKDEQFTWKDFEATVGRTFTPAERTAIRQRLNAS